MEKLEGHLVAQGPRLKILQRLFVSGRVRTGDLARVKRT